jgi:hypothetical protein
MPTPESSSTWPCTERGSRITDGWFSCNLHRTYAALNTWCSQRALALTGQSWEVYGDWTEDPSKLETGLFLRVDEA